MSCSYPGCCEHHDAEHHIHSETGPVGQSVTITQAQLDAFLHRYSSTLPAPPVPAEAIPDNEYTGAVEHSRTAQPDAYGDRLERPCSLCDGTKTHYPNGGPNVHRVSYDGHVHSYVGVYLNGPLRWFGVQQPNPLER